MLNYSVAPTEANALDLFLSNAINRNKDLYRFLSALDAIDDCCSIALNGDWGSGKTIFIKQAKMLLDSFNPNSPMPQDIRERIKNVLPKGFNRNGTYSAVYYDAWANDNDADPLLSLIYATVNSQQATLNDIAKRDLTSIVAAVVEVVSGRNITKALEEIRGSNPLKLFEEQKSIAQLMHHFFDTLIQEHGNRLVIFIDELDRCSPLYAVRMLERIKHYFDDDRITFVFSVNLAELQNTVRCYYGSEFNASRYLDKFFDLRMSLPAVDYVVFLAERLKYPASSYIFDKVVLQTIKYFKFSLRETERYIRLIKIAFYQVAHSDKFHGDPEEDTFFLCCYYIVPIILGLSIFDLEGCRRFVSGSDYRPMAEILTSFDKNSFSFFKKRIQKEPELLDSEVNEKLQQIYFALFKKEYGRSEYGLAVGDLVFTANMGKRIIEIVSLFSPHATYDLSE